MSLLDEIQSENDIKNIPKSEYKMLAEEIRQFLIDKVSQKGGHLASNLGAVELTMALHLCMNFPEDKLIFDVGHQSYTHKLLTGRKEGFDTLREYGGMSGFPKTRESECDAFNTGHSSTSISAAMGLAAARDKRGGKEKIVAVIGDGSLTGGLSYEAINSLCQFKSGLIVVLNDNEMSIGKNVGGLSKYLNDIRMSATYNGIKTGVESSLLGSKTGVKVAKKIKQSKDSIRNMLIPGMFFDELGLTYVGPIDGHDVEAMVKTFNKAFKLNKPIVIHVTTTKGKGYSFAEKHPDYFHGISAFDVQTGKVIAKKSTSSYTDIFSKHLVEMGREHEDIVAITAAMSIGTGLHRFAQEFSDRFYDVGIAEQHAVTFAAGLAIAKMTPVVAVYSSFLQRAYDQILHDVCLQNLHVIFAVDRSGLVGADGETHQGIYDISYLTQMPNMTVMAPKNRYELVDMMNLAYTLDGPVAIKYPRGDAYKGYEEYNAPLELNKSEIIYEGSEVTIISVGHMLQEADKLCEMLKHDGINPTLVNARFLNSVDDDMLKKVCPDCKVVVTLEENVAAGGYGEKVISRMALLGLCKSDMTIIQAAIDYGIVEQGSISELRKKTGIDAESVYNKIKNAIQK